MRPPFTLHINGKDLMSGSITSKTPPVEPVNVWSVVDRTICCTGTPFGYLATTMMHENDILKVKNYVKAME